MLEIDLVMDRLVDAIQRHARRYGPTATRALIEPWARPRPAQLKHVPHGDHSELARRLEMACGIDRDGWKP